MRPSSRARGVSESETLRLAAEIARLRAAGREVISLLEGESDLPAPPAVVAATARALRAGRTRYSSSTGLPELKTALVRALRAENGVAASPDGIVVTNGAKQAIYEVLQAVCGPGDEVLVPVPYWVTFPEAVKLSGARPVFVPTDGGAIDPDAVARAVTRRTKALILNSPNNPTGAVQPRETMKALADLARRGDFLILSDEAYQHLVFDGRERVSPAALSRDAARRTVTIQTFSKSYSMTGFRVGYLSADPAIARAVARIHGHVTGNACTFAQHGALAALELGAAFHERRRADYERRRDLAHAAASRLFPVAKPQGGFFLWADARARLRGRTRTTGALAERLLRESGVAVVPGSACGVEGFLRISFSSSERNAREGFRRLEAAL